MDNFSCPPGSSAIVTFDELKAALRFLSHEQHQWQARLNLESAAETYGSPQSSVEIRYTNPQFVDLPNEISYLFPAFNESILGMPYVLVCLHPSLAVPVQEGLYFEGAALKHDLLEDWYRFWPLLIAAVYRPRECFSE
jgi:hypothetical protein